MTSTSARLPVSILSGFLGSGKTTLLNRLLKRPEMAGAAVIVNELGAIGIDRALLSAAPGEVVQLDSGCLCCGLLNDFRETLASLLERRARGEIPAFERVLVETTGLADPAPILQTLLNDPILRPHFRLEGLTTVVDALHGAVTLAEHGEARAQVALADRLIVSKTDLTAGRCPPPLAAALDRLNRFATRSLAIRGDVEVGLVVGGPGAAVPGGAGAGSDDAARETARHDDAVVSEAFVLPRPATWAGVAGWTDFAREFFGDRLLRCKGILEVAEIGRPIVIQGVRRVFASPETLAQWPDADHRSRLVCISRGIEPGLLRSSLGMLHAEPGTYPPASLDELRNLPPAAGRGPTGFEAPR